ncbi:ArsR/SmtB family transcription factor [Aestuariimicrobium sp. Y1814]|uniref:ArsR/SmtB family transcription factor n=1 Tax=Aestuariimicrobium sp. Y1814 TaxID=3418742 RepID=UPI003DA6DED8
MKDMTDTRGDPGDGTGHCSPEGSGGLLGTGAATSLAAVFKALSDPTRVRLLRYLADSAGGTVCACHLPGALGITQPTLSFHMRKLQDAGLVDREQRGRWAHWSVSAQALVPIRAFLALDPLPSTGQTSQHEDGHLYFS